MPLIGFPIRSNKAEKAVLMAVNRLKDRFPNAAYRLERAVVRSRETTLGMRSMAAAGFAFIVTTLGLLTAAAFYTKQIETETALVPAVEIDVPSRMASRIDERILLERQRYASRLNEQLSKAPPITGSGSSRQSDLLRTNERETSSVEITIPPQPVKRPEKRLTANSKRKSEAKQKQSSKLANRQLTIDKYVEPSRRGRRVELDGPTRVTATAGADFDLPLAIIDPTNRARSGQVIVGGLPPSATLDIGKKTGKGTWKVPAKDSDIAVVRLPKTIKKDFRLTMALRAPGIDPPLIRRVQIKVKQPKRNKPVHIVKAKPDAHQNVKVTVLPKPTPPLTQQVASQITNGAIDAQRKLGQRTMVSVPQQAAAPVEIAKPSIPRRETNSTETVSTDLSATVKKVTQPAHDAPASVFIEARPEQATANIEKPKEPSTSSVALEEPDNKSAQTVPENKQEQELLPSTVDEKVAKKKTRTVRAPRPQRARRKRTTRKANNTKPEKERGGYNNLGWNPFNSN